MIAAGRIVFAILIALAAVAAGPAAAIRIDDDDRPDRILIANPSRPLAAHLVSRGFAVESVERLDALSLSLMIVAPPRHLAAEEALEALHATFPKAIVARDDPVYLAADARSGRGQVNDQQRVLTSIG